MILLHGTTRHRAERILQFGPDPRYHELGGQGTDDGFSLCLESGLFFFGMTEDYARGKAREFPDKAAMSYWFRLHFTEGHCTIRRLGADEADALGVPFTKVGVSCRTDSGCRPVQRTAARFGHALSRGRRGGARTVCVPIAGRHAVHLLRFVHEHAFPAAPGTLLLSQQVP
jgi:hypothetical protein